MQKNSKNKIKECALDLFTRNGYKNTSIRMIASSANISIGLMYNYYKSKSMLLKAIFMQELYPVKSAFLNENTILDQSHLLKHILNEHFKMIRHNLRFWKLYYNVRMQPSVLRQIQIDTNSLSGDLFKELSNFFRYHHGKDPITEAKILYSIIDGITLHYVLAPRRYPLKEAIESIIKKYSTTD